MSKLPPIPRAIPTASQMWSGFPLQHKSLFYRQLATMINAASSISASVRVAASLYDKMLGEEMARLIDQGYKLSQVLTRYPHYFSDYEIAVVSAGEYSGRLDEQLLGLATELEKNHQLEYSFRAKLFYPALILHCSIFIPPIVILVTKGMAAYMRATMGILIPLYIVWFSLMLAYRLASQSGGMRRTMDSVILWIPLVGGAVKMLCLTRCLRALGNLYETGILPDKALQVACQSCGNQEIAAQIESVQRKLGDQVPVSRVLAVSRVFPKMVTSMMETGEQSGVPSKMLLKVAEHLEQEANLKIHRLATLAPVFALFFAAGAVAWQVFGVFGGLLKTYQQLM
jgi:type II secretory pathway component PulF